MALLQHGAIRESIQPRRLKGHEVIPPVMPFVLFAIFVVLPFDVELDLQDDPIRDDLRPGVAPESCDGLVDGGERTCRAFAIE